MGILGGQKSRKCHELSRKSIKLVFTHPTRGCSRGGLGSKFQKSGKFHELSRKSIKKIYSGVGVKISRQFMKFTGGGGGSP